MDAEGLLRAVLPTRCVYARGREQCSPYVDHYRERKTGPRHPVAVVGCGIHEGSRYTLYPPGHYPHGREALAPCSGSGELLREAGRKHVAWGATLFAAALDAARGVRWPSWSPSDDARRRRTQGRRLDVAGRLLGVHGEQAPWERERIATRLGVATLVLLDAARRWARSWTGRGAAVVAVLDALPLEATLLDRLLAAGELGGLWPEARRWDTSRGAWTLLPRSGAAELPAVEMHRSRGPPPTTLRVADRESEAASSGS